MRREMTFLFASDYMMFFFGDNLAPIDTHFMFLFFFSRHISAMHFSLMHCKRMLPVFGQCISNKVKTNKESVQNVFVPLTPYCRDPMKV